MKNLRHKRRLFFCLMLVSLSLMILPEASAEGAQELFSKSDYNNISEEVPDAVITLEGDHGTLSDTTRGKSGNPVVIKRKGIYRVTGESDGVTILVEEPKRSGNIYLVLDNVSMSNSEACITVEGAEKVILHCLGENRIICTSDEKAAIYSREDVTVNGPGRLEIVSGKNGIQSTGTLRITGAELSIQAENDGLKAKRGLYIDGGTICVSKSYESVEAAEVVICGGELTLYASDDGINAASDDEESQGDVIIKGGEIYLNAGGDAIDSNRSIIIEGGILLVEGPENNRNSIFDKGDTEGSVRSISGGTVLAIGSAEKAKNFKDGTQYSRLETVSGEAGDVISTDDGSGVTLTATKSFGCVIYSSPTFNSGSSITVTKQK